MGSAADPIVISGISGRFPESDSVQEFISNLLANKDLVTANQRRFKPGTLGLPKGFGTLKQIDHFDAEFFGVLPKQAERMDPQLRIGLETTYEAIFDAGVNPGEQRGTRTGVFTAIISHEAFELWGRQPDKMDGGNLIGSLGAMLPNRISYCFDFNGPSASYDTACSSSIFALDAAVTSIQTGKCDAAVVMGACLIINPIQSLIRDQAGMLARDATPRSFDPDGLGYVRAETVATIYLQKLSIAKRAYAVVVGIGTNTDGYKERGTYHPSSMMQEHLFQQIYQTANVNPADVTYVEAHGTGTPAGDPEEVKAISRHFCLNKKRKEPLLIGSVKSSMGHAESASGLCSIAKVVAMLQNGIIPANLHYNRPHYNMNAIREGRIQVVDKNTEWKGGYVGLNCFGFGGVNTHAILKPILAPPTIPNGTTPINEADFKNLVTLPGRTRAGVELKLKEILTTANFGQIHLLNEINRNPIKGERVRGFGIIGTDTFEVMEVTQSRPQLWFVFNGVGSQWLGMGRSLMEIQPFRAVFDACVEALRPYDYNLHEIFFSDDPETYSDPTNVFVCIGVTQIGLVDILRVLGLKPDGLLGHSAGESVCAYADNCMSISETISAIYLRGKPCKDLKALQSEEFGMAVVPLTAGETSRRCPAGLHTACHNAPESSTVSGPMSIITEFRSQLAKEGIEVKAVDSCGMAFHSPYISEAAIAYRALLQPLLEPIARSQTWVSTSVPEEKWRAGGMLFSAEYLYNNMTSPVLFTEALKHVPEDAVVIEIGPSGLLRGLIQKGTKGTTVVPLQIRNTDGLSALQKALGKLYLAGINFDLNSLIGEKVERPLPGNTPLLGHLFDWDHSQTWHVPQYGDTPKEAGGVYEVCLGKPEEAYLAGHLIRGRTLYPAAGYLCLVWKYFAALNSCEMEEFPVVFEDVQFLRVTLMRTNENTEFRVNVLESVGSFEVREGGAAVCTGRIRQIQSLNEEKVLDGNFQHTEKAGLDALSNEEETLTSDDIYRRLRFLGYEYGDLFKGILKADLRGNYFEIGWNSNWISFLDALLQSTIRIYSAADYQSDLSVPTQISKLLLHPLKFQENLDKARTRLNSDELTVFSHYNSHTHLIKCIGVEIEGLKMTKMSSKRKDESPPIFSQYAFEPHIYAETGEIWDNNEHSPLIQCISIVMENFSSMHDRIKMTIPAVFEICTKASSGETLDISRAIRVHFSLPDIDYNLFVHDFSPQIAEVYSRSRVKVNSIEQIREQTGWMMKRYDLIIIDDALFLKSTLGGLRKGGFLIYKNSSGINSKDTILDKLPHSHQLIAHKYTEFYDVYLIRRDTRQKCKDVEVIELDSSVEWVDGLREAMLRQEHYQMSDLPCPRLYLVSNGPSAVGSGVLGLTLCLRKEPCTQHLRCLYSVNKIPLDFDKPDERLKRILHQDLVQTVINENDREGCYIHSVVSKRDMMIRTTSAYANVEALGDMSTFRWDQGIPFDQLPAYKGFSTIQVHAVGLSFQDVMVANGNLQLDLSRSFPHCYQSPLGLEFSGVRNDGRRVCGISNAQCIATQVLAPEDLMWDTPSKWTFEEAATVPLVYTTAFLALVIRGKIQPGESILIHSGAGGVGMAAIYIALHYKCKIFTTVGSDRKMTFLKAHFPQIPASQIAFSRDSRFEQTIRSATGGRGVDVILNSLSGDKLVASGRCLAPLGRFLDIGRVDIAKNKSLGMDLFLRDATFHGIQLQLLLNDPSQKQIRSELSNLVRQGIECGIVHPLPYRMFTKDQLEPAFRWMNQGTHTGKVIISVRPSSSVPLAEFRVPANPAIYFHPLKVYIVLGGLGGVGLEFVNWLTLRNARKVIITCRSGKLYPYSRNYLQIWKERGADVRIMKKNAIYQDQAEELIQEALGMGPIGGFFNLTMELDVGLMRDQTKERFEMVTDPKIKITQHLDQLSRQWCPELDHFVLFSSISSGLGYDGQGNYGCANSGAERLIEKRVRDGLPGKAVQWGAIGEVGGWHERYNRDFKRTDFHGSGVQSIESVLKSLDTLFSIAAPVTLCRRLVDVDMSVGVELPSDEASLMDRIAHILGHTNSSKLNSKNKLVDLGMDSLMSIEVTHVLEKEYGLELSAGEIRSYTLEQLNEMGSNSRNQQAMVAVGVPKAKSATKGLVQLNLLKSISRSRFVQDHVLYPINLMGKEKVQIPGLPTVFVCNSIEGPDVLRVLGDLIKAPCYSLQFSSFMDLGETTFDAVANVFMGKLREVAPYGPYVVAGLSAGAFPAYELAIKLQATGEIRELIWMDMTFERFTAIMEENFPGRTIDDLSEDELMLMIHTTFFGFDRFELEQILREETTAEGKMERMIELMQNLADGEFDESGLRQMFHSNWKVLFHMLCHYEVIEKFHHGTTLIKTTQQLIAYDSSIYWGLEKICTQPIKLLEVDTTHSYLIAEPAVHRVAEVINNALTIEV